MKSFSVFCVEIVWTAIELNEFIVMAGIVKFRDVKMLANTKRDEDVMV